MTTTTAPLRTAPADPRRAYSAGCRLRGARPRFRSSRTTTLAYDFESRLTSVGGPGISASYAYNGLDTRVSKLENGVSNTFVRDGDYVTDPVLRDGAASYTPGISERRGTVSTYLHGGLKNAVTQGAQNGTLSATRTYDAFGNVTASTGTWRGPFGYAGAFGYQEDQTGLRLLGHRYYDSSTGRFLTRDPIKDGRNWYAYGAGETAPTNGVDPDGLQMQPPGWSGRPGTRPIVPGNGTFRPGIGWGGGSGRPSGPRSNIGPVRPTPSFGSMPGVPNRALLISRFYETLGRAPRGHESHKWRNKDWQLPPGDYIMIDIRPLPKGKRGDERLVIDRGTGATYYSPNHYDDFIRIR